MDPTPIHVFDVHAVDCNGNMLGVILRKKDSLHLALLVQNEIEGFLAEIATPPQYSVQKEATTTEVTEDSSSISSYESGAGEAPDNHSTAV